MFRVVGPKSSFSTVFDMALFGSSPLFDDNYIQFQPEMVKIADVSINSLCIYAEYDRGFFSEYDVYQTTNFAITSSVHSMFKKTFPSQSEITMGIEGLSFSLTSPEPLNPTRAKYVLQDNLKDVRRESGHTTPDKFPPVPGLRMSL